MTYFNDQQAASVFINTPLEGNYNFLAEDLTKLANAFAASAAPKIAREERAECVKVAKSVNVLVGTKIESVRGQK